MLLCSGLSCMLCDFGNILSVVINLCCQLGKLLGISVRNFLEYINSIRKIHPACGWYLQLQARSEGLCTFWLPDYVFCCWVHLPCCCRFLPLTPNFIFFSLQYELKASSSPGILQAFSVDRDCWSIQPHRPKICWVLRLSSMKTTTVGQLTLNHVSQSKKSLLIYIHSTDSRESWLTQLVN